jgi:hypothetical protein
VAPEAAAASATKQGKYFSALHFSVILPFLLTDLEREEYQS